jgi:hypothetical protein
VVLDNSAAVQEIHQVQEARHDGRMVPAQHAIQLGPMRQPGKGRARVLSGIQGVPQAATETDSTRQP